MSPLRLIGAAVAAAFLLVSPLSAQTLQDGIDAWLADDDATALPILSERAKAGDADAQMLLGQIEAVTPPGASTAYVSALPRRDRIDLFRSEGGLSGTSWLRVRAEAGDEVATALLASRLPDAGMDVAATLAEAGEIEAAARLAWEIFDRGRWNEIFALPADDPTMAELDFVAWMRSYFAEPPQGNPWDWLSASPAEGRSGGIMMMTLVAPVLAPHLRPQEELRNYALAQRGFPQQLANSQRLGEAAEVMSGQLDVDPNLATVAAYCDATCPAERGFCALEVIAEVGGADNIRLHDTPLERLIPHAQFAGSPRAVGQLRRWMGSIGESSVSGNLVISQCTREDIRSAAAIQ